MTRSTLLVLVALTTSSLFGCSASNVAPSSGSAAQGIVAAVDAPKATATCTPVPLPTPNIILLEPAPAATGVPRIVKSVRFQIVYGDADAKRLVLSPRVGAKVPATRVDVEGTPGPHGELNYRAIIAGRLAPRTKYNVMVSGKQTFGGCSNRYSSPSGFFKTDRN